LLTILILIIKNKRVVTLSEKKETPTQDLDEGNISIIEEITQEVLELKPPNDKIIAYHLVKKKEEGKSKSMD